jgi:hypothetical protein
VLDLARGLEGACEVAIDKDAAFSAREAIDATGEPDAQAADALGERIGVSGLDDQVQVVSQDAVMDQPKARRCLALPETLLELERQLLAAQVGQ